MKGNQASSGHAWWRLERAAGRRCPRDSERYARLDAVLKEPVLKKQLFDRPVIIESVAILRLDNSLVFRVRSPDGAKGISRHFSRGMSTLFPIFLKNLRPLSFLGRTHASWTLSWTILWHEFT